MRRTNDEPDLNLENKRRIPGVCLHVREDGSDGCLVDDLVRVCGIECASDWAKMRGRVLAGESIIRDLDGNRLSVNFTTTTSGELQRPSSRFPKEENDK